MALLDSLLTKISSIRPKWMPDDKFKHGVLCSIPPFFIGWIGAVYSLGLGTGKEIGDMFNPKSKFCVKDMIANIIGIAIGTLLHYITIRPVFNYTISLFG